MEVFIDMLLKHIFYSSLVFYVIINIYWNLIASASERYKGMHTKWHILLSLTLLNIGLRFKAIPSGCLSEEKLALGKRLNCSIKLFEGICLGGYFYKKTFLLMKSSCSLSWRLANWLVVAVFDSMAKISSMLWDQFWL